MTPERRNKLLKVVGHRQNNITVVLENVFDPHNVSAVMRTCDAIGIQDIYTLNTRIPPHKKWGYKSSSSANKWMTVHQFTEVNECIKELRRHYNRILTTHLSGDSVSLYELDLTQSIALVFGNEHDGISGEIIANSDGNFVIPQVGIIRSLNISVACAVTVYEAYIQKKNAGHYEKQTLSVTQADLLLNEWGLDRDGMA
jgi:tRNA (guanosine-2'-O-)-methyltransferase